MQSPLEIALFVLFGLLIVVGILFMYGHRLLAQRLERDPVKRSARSVDFAAFWPQITLAMGFPVMAVVLPLMEDDVTAAGHWMLTGFFAIGVVWMLAVQRWNWYLRYMANSLFAVTMGSQEHGESPEKYLAAIRRALPWATALVAVAFAISLVQLLAL